MGYKSKSQADKKRILKVIKILKDWEDADIFSYIKKNNEKSKV